jgi:hypothetical protein
MTITKFSFTSLLACSAMLLFSTTACSPTSPVAVVAAVDAFAQAAVSDLATSGVIKTAAGVIISNDLTLVVSALDKTASEEASADTAAVKASNILLIWAGVALDPAAAALLPPAVQYSLNALSAGIKALVAYFQAVEPSIAAHTALADKAATASFTDRRRLHSIRSDCGRMLKSLNK